MKKSIQNHGQPISNGILNFAHIFCQTCKFMDSTYGYWFGGYCCYIIGDDWLFLSWCLLMTILLMVIDNYYIVDINGYQQLFYQWLLMVILLVVISAYFINGYQ